MSNKWQRAYLMPFNGSDRNIWGQWNIWGQCKNYIKECGIASTREISDRRLSKDELNETFTYDIKQCQETGFVLGSDKIRKQFEEIINQSQFQQNRGPKAKRQM